MKIKSQGSENYNARVNIKYSLDKPRITFKYPDKKHQIRGTLFFEFRFLMLFVALFIVAIIGFSIGFARDNSSPVSIADDSELINTYGNVSGNIGGFQTSSSETLNSTLSTTISPTSASGTTTTAGQYSLILGDLYGVAKNTLRLGYSKIFGNDSGFGIFITTFLSVIAFIFTYYIIKAWIGRTPD